MLINVKLLMPDGDNLTVSMMVHQEYRTRLQIVTLFHANSGKEVYRGNPIPLSHVIDRALQDMFSPLLVDWTVET